MRGRVVRAVLAALSVSLFLIAAPQPTEAVSDPSDPVFINEFHYDNTGDDAGEFVEIAGPAGTDLTAWSLYLYTGADGTNYDLHALSGSIDDEGGSGYGAVSASIPLQNGSPDAIALVDASNTVVQFLSYEGTFTGVGGPAMALLSTDVGVAEDGDEAVGLSLGLTGTGFTYGDFTWTTGLDDSPGSINPDQAFPLTGLSIHDIQGAAHASPVAGNAVSEVTGIVTGLVSNGFYLQEPAPDANDATSEGIFVFTSATPTVALGDAVSVDGSVVEFTPGGDPNNLSITEITVPAISVNSTGNPLPAPIVVGVNGRSQPKDVIDDDALAVFDPANDGLDYYESLEAMRVQVNSAQAVGRTIEFGPSVHEIAVVPGDDPAVGLRTPRGGIVYQGYDQANPEILVLSDSPAVNGTNLLPNVDVGASLGSLVGIVHYSFGRPKLLVTHALSGVTASTNVAEVTGLVHAAGKLTLATFNLENLGGNDLQAKFDGLAAQIVDNLLSPDIIVAEEVQDNDGTTGGSGSSTVAANTTFEGIVDAIVDAGGPTYSYRQINPVDDQDGGEPGGNTRVGFLFRTDTGVAFVDRPGGGSTVPTDIVDNGGTPQLEHSPGRIDPTNSAFNNVRKPLVGEFTFGGETFFVVGSHWNSKGGDQPLFGANQPPVRSSEVQRQAIATRVEDFVDDITAIDSAAKVVIAGDLNDFVFSPAVQTLTSNGYTSLVTTLPANERYGYVFEGDSFVLDHILASSGAAPGAEFDTVHVNSEFFVQQSDHDPSIARFTVAGAVPSVSVADKTIVEGDSGTRNLVFRVSLSGPSTDEVRVRFKTVNGTATGLGSDYASRNFVLVFAPGQTSKGVIVAVKGDTVVEPDETFTVRLLQPVNATIGDGTAVGRINNDD